MNYTAEGPLRKIPYWQLHFLYIKGDPAQVPLLTSARAVQPGEKGGGHSGRPQTTFASISERQHTKLHLDTYRQPVQIIEHGHCVPTEIFPLIGKLIRYTLASLVNGFKRAPISAHALWKSATKFNFTKP